MSMSEGQAVIVSNGKSLKFFTCLLVPVLYYVAANHISALVGLF